MIGTVLKHRYTVQEKIGEGNLFSVYRCEDKIEDRQVAIKVLLPQYASNRMFAERLLVEAQAMIGISHPGIVEVYDCGEEEGNYFVVMEYIRGVDLKERIRRNAPFTLTTAVDVGLAICDVLDFAHKRGFVHGDLRPGNILVTPEGQIKLTNFWVGNAVNSSQSIRTNAMMRSVHYMSPEVAEGIAPTPVSDVYSLGVILFELLSGQLPFDGDTPIAIALRHARDPVPSLRAQNPGVPKTLEAAIVKSMQKAPEDRFRSAKAMLNELKSQREALNLNKPLVWSQVTEKKAPDPLPEPDEEPDEVEEARPVVLSALRTTLLIIVITIVAAMMAIIGFIMVKPANVTVPNMVGKSFDQAQILANDKKFQLVIRSEQFNEKFPAGTVYFMHPDPGFMIKSGKTVEVWVSKGSQFATVPNVANIPEDEARNRLTDAGVNVGEITESYSATVPAGNVISQMPRPGTKLERNVASVNIVYSLGPKPSEEPLISPDDSTSETPQAPRSFDIKVTVPQGGPETQNVKIVVIDDNGENTAYSDTASPGDHVEQTIEGVGNRVTIRIYIDDKLVREERKWR